MPNVTAGSQVSRNGDKDARAIPDRRAADARLKVVCHAKILRSFRDQFLRNWRKVFRLCSVFPEPILHAKPLV